MTVRVFVDGSTGTTGLRIAQRLRERPDLHLVTLPDHLRKNTSARAEALTNADAAILCLPDAAAVEAVTLAGDSSTVIIDASTAHRVNPAWTYGFPEIHGQRERIMGSTRIANPGCHASGFIALVTPLIHAQALQPSAALSCFSLTGYSGGGKQMIAHYEQPATQRDPLLTAPRAYALTQAHKHIPEMMTLCQLHSQPAFTPIVANFYAGMEVTVQLPAGALPDWNASRVTNLYADYYAGETLIQVSTADDGDGFLSAAAYAGRDDMMVGAFGGTKTGGAITLVARFDNLGKGASGAAIQNLNIALGMPEATGLVCGPAL